MASAETESTVFRAFITPHRSLSRRGAAYVIAVFAAFTGLFCLRFWLAGAWPVMLFSLIDIPLIALALALNFQRARQSECLMLTDRTLTIVQTDPRGHCSQVSLATAWLRVSLREDAGASRIVLTTRGSDQEVGAFLHEPDRLALYEGLKEALYRLRNPVFDNPQLRDG